MMKVEIKRTGETKFEEVPDVVSFALDNLGLIFHHPNRRQSGIPYHDITDYKISAKITAIQTRASQRAMGLELE
jgi:hypothetical protein